MTVTIPELAPGMNVLMRMHFHTYADLRNKWQTMLRVGFGTKRFKGASEVLIVRYHCGTPMDLDNLWSTPKIPLDAMVRASILPGDDPGCVAALKVEQRRVPTRKEVRTEITVEELNPSGTAAPNPRN